MNDFLLGALAMASIVAGLYFLKFWRKTRDRFFLFFSLAFFVEAINRTIIHFTGESGQMPFPFPRIIRLASFCLFLFALIDKNLKKRRF